MSCFAGAGKATTTAAPAAAAVEEGGLPDIETQVQGLQKRELDAVRHGKPVFPTNQGLLTGPFGTEANPVKVPSAFSSRIVGCTGGSGDHSHELLWHEVREGETTVCMACGQFFTLDHVVVDDGHHHDEHSHDDKAHASH